MPFEDPNVTSSTEPSEENGAAKPQPAAVQAHNNPPEPPKPTAGRTRNEENMTEDFATALESFEQEQSEQALAEDRVLTGTVLSITPQYVVVDVGLKSEGVVPLEEVKDHDGNVSFQPGDQIDVMQEKGHTEEGYVHLSHQKAQRLQAWDEIEKAYNEKSSIKARVIDRIKGGLTVDIWVHGPSCPVPRSTFARCATSTR